MKRLWTDGSAVPNPGPGGWAVLEDRDGHPQHVQIVALGRARFATNNQMEGKAIVAALRYANGEKCEIYTDSDFWWLILTQWARRWERNGWRRLDGENVQNLKLVQTMWRLYKKSDARLVLVPGHSNVALNEMADAWARRARGSFDGLGELR